MKHVIRFLLGILIGGCLLVPGMSVGTLIIILGFYDIAINYLGTFYKSKKNFLDAVIFFAPLGLGALIGLFTLSYLLMYLIAEFSLPTFALFAGFVSGVIPFIIAKLYRGKTAHDHFKWWHTIPAIIACALVITLALLQPTETGTRELSPAVAIMIFICGIIASADMLIPGISGSFILVILGYYATILGAVTNFNFAILAIFACGAIIGLLISARFVNFMLMRFHTLSHMAIAGLLIGSVISLFMLDGTYASAIGTFGIIASFITFTLGFICTFTFSKISQHSPSSTRP